MNTSTPSTWRGIETFSTHVSYNYDMPNVDDDTKIVSDNSSKNIDNYMVKVSGDGFNLVLLHTIKITGNHVDEAEIVGTWHFKSLDHLKKQGELIIDSVKRQSSQT